ncbi:TlpA family protein disulfide reductase [Hymenobacter sp. DG25A]|uniref:TlpA family protein disulfide reductase n=1 Tax=Hymenobacter sp. DG25A TaxID=1385663 RepID=UPI0009EADEFF|nr:TlpA disulfide reductase family protein [Hymenobacter sp. DG25A]
MLLSLSAFLLSAVMPLLLGPATPPQAPRITVVQGHIDHAPTTADTVRVWYSQFKKAKAALSPNGDFRVEIPDLTAPTAGMVEVGRQHTSLYFSPGDKLQLTLDFPRFDETVRYTGRGAEANNYLAQSLYTFEFGQKSPVPSPNMLLTATTTPEQMRQRADAFRQARLDFLQAYAKKHKLSPDFRSEATRRITIRWANSLMDYPAYYLGVNRKPAALPANYYDFLQGLPLSTLYEQMSGDQDENSTAMMLLINYRLRLLPTDSLTADPAQARQMYDLATRELGRTPTRDQAMYLLLSYQLEKTLPGVLAAYPTFRAENRDSSASQQLRRQIEKRQNVQPGLAAPNFTLQDNTGKTVSLHDLRGKVVYLDFWGTWCPPCLQEMPASLRLRQQFAGRDVVFVYISVGDKEDKWQRVLADKQLTGPGSVHLRSTGSTDAENYQVFSFPAYYIIGRDGRLLQAGAPRPSAGQPAVTALEAALQLR